MDSEQMAGGDKQTGDFTGQQFTEDSVAAKVQEQYGEAHARTFYTYACACDMDCPFERNGQCLPLGAGERALRASTMACHWSA